MADDTTTPSNEPDGEGKVFMHHVGLKAETRVFPKSLPLWERRGWKPGPLSSQAVTAAEQAGTPIVTPDPAGGTAAQTPAQRRAGTPA